MVLICLTWDYEGVKDYWKIVQQDYLYSTKNKNGAGLFAGL